MKLRFDAEALVDLDRILAYIAERNPAAARRLAKRISGVIARLERFPHSARGRRGDDCRILVIPGTRYVALSRVKTDEVQILRIFHGAQNFPR